MVKTILIIIALLAVAGIVFMYANTNTLSEEAPGEEAVGNNTPPPALNEPSPTPTESVKTFTVTGQNFSFDPASLAVTKGDRVRITFKSASGFHDFKIDEFKVATKQLQGGQEETIEFIADKAGVFEYYCSVGNHRAMGMKGTLTVQ